MSRARVTKAELEREVAALRARVAELEEVELEHRVDVGALDVSRAELAAVFQTAPVMMMILGSDRRVREINRAAEQVIARSAEEVNGRRFGNAVYCVNALADPKGCGYGPNCESCPLRRIVSDTFETHRGQDQVEATLTFGDSEEWQHKHLMVSTALIELPKERLVLVCVQDVTESKRAEEALRGSEQRYRLLFERNLAGVYRTTLDGTILDCNESMASMLGYHSRQEVVALHASDLYLELADREAFLKRLKETGVLTNSELSLRRKDGSPIHILENVILLPDEEGVPAVIQGTAVDITERKRTEEALLEAHEILERLLAATPVCIAYMDTEFNFIRVNRAYAEADGRTPESFAGKRHFDLYPSEENEAIFRRVVETGEPCSYHGKPFEYRGRPERGVTYWDWNLHPVKDATGKVDGVLLCLVDVTAREESEKLARERQAALARVSRISTIAEMASGLAHELTQPLGAVCTYADACRKMVASGRVADLSETVEKIAGQARRAARIVGRIRGFVAKRESDRSTVDINELIEESLSMIGEEIRKARVEVSLELSEEAPVVQADSVQIQQLVVNLVRNAIDAIQRTSEGPRVLTIRSRVEPDGAAGVAVCDSGVGLGGEVSDRMFEPFFTTKPGGLGLGLLISRSIVERHGGRLWATANQARGTTFHLTIPASGVPDDDEC